MKYLTLLLSLLVAPLVAQNPQLTNYSSLQWDSGVAANLPGFCSDPGFYFATDTSVLYGCHLGHFVATGATGPGPISGATTGAIVTAASATTLQTPCVGCSVNSSGVLSGITSAVIGNTVVPLTTVDVRSQGAICSGNSHPASGFYASLGLLQAKYSFATALTNEMDWLGTQLAINTVIATGGGTVTFPLGASCIFSNSNSSADLSGTIALPEASNFFGGGGTPVSLTGIGGGAAYSVVLKWPSDLGTGKFAILDTNRQTTATGNYGQISYLSLVGPASTFTIGTSPANMSGLGQGAFRSLTNVSVSGFRSGIDISGGVFNWFSVTSTHNYYDVYFSTPNSQYYGNIVMNGCVFQLATLAAIGVSQDAVIAQTQVIGTYLTASPFGLYKETNSGSPSQPILADYSDFLDCTFEVLGNGISGDDRNSASAPILVFYEVSFVRPFFSWSATYKYSAVGQFAIFTAAQAASVNFEEIHFPGNWTPGSAGIFDVLQSAAFDVSGNISQLITNAQAAASSANYVFANNSNAYFTLTNLYGPRWTAFTAQSSSVVGPGYAVNCASQAYQLFVSITGGNTSDAPCGIVMHVGGATGAGTNSNTTVIVADSGTVAANSSGTWTASAGVHYVRTGASGTIVQATNSVDTTSPIMGAVSINPSTTTPSIVQIKLQRIK